MKTTLIGIVTFGNLEFTRLTVNSIRESAKEPIDFFLVVGKPNDDGTAAWLTEQRIPFVQHRENKGFPASLNDIYDYAWPSMCHPAHSLRYGSDYDNLIISGNDVVPYPDGVDSLIREANHSEWEWICSSQFDVKSLVDRYPEARPYFEGPTMIFKDFTAKPWELHKDFHANQVEPNQIKDVHNLCLYKRSVHEKIGYIDVGFFPAYFSDNDYCTRALRAGVKACGLAHSAYFHFWSRTIHQGVGGSTDRYFKANAEYYQMKWGGSFGHEQFQLPFGGRDFELHPGLRLPGTIRIGDRQDEGRIVEYWKGRP